LEPVTVVHALKMRHHLRVASTVLWPISATCGWIVAAALLAFAAPSLLRNHLRLAEAVVYSAAALGGFGGLVGFWYSASAIEFVVRGYQVCRLSNGRWAYAERRPDGAIAHLTLGYNLLADIYRPPCEVHVPSEAEWDSATPTWAHGRRAEILRNIGKDMSIETGREIQFVDVSGDSSRDSLPPITRDG
jgi:hypothetical protein